MTSHSHTSTTAEPIVEALRRQLPDHATIALLAELDGVRAEDKAIGLPVLRPLDDESATRKIVLKSRRRGAVATLMEHCRLAGLVDWDQTWDFGDMEAALDELRAWPQRYVETDIDYMGDE